MVDYRVEQGISKVIRAAFADPTLLASDSRPDRLKNVTFWFLLQGDEEGFAQEHADLLAANLLIFFEIKHLRDDEKIVIILFHFWTLVGIEHVFQGQRVQIETLPEDTENAQVAQAIDVDPGD